MKLVIALLLAMLVSVVSTHADSANISVSGSMTHGGSITITGTGFGSKTTAAPVVWDNCDHGQAVTARWSGAWPDATEQPSSTIRYAASGSIESVNTAHSLASNYMAGRTYDGASSGQGFPSNAMVWKTFSYAMPAYYYTMFYARVGPNHLSGASDTNFKYFDYSSGGSPYDMISCTRNNWYIEQINGVGGGHHIQDDTWGYCIPGALYMQGDLCTDCDYLWRPRTFSSVDDWKSSWSKIEIIVYITNSEDGWVDVYENGTHQIGGYGSSPTYCNSWCNSVATTGTHSYNGRTDTWTSSVGRNIGIGGYTDPQNSANWRFWNDIYLDNSFSRVMICTGSTWASRGTCEPQIPTAWADTSITATVNRAAFGAVDSGYLYVVDSSNVANATGVSVTFGDESPTPTPTPTPTPQPHRSGGSPSGGSWSGQ